MAGAAARTHLLGQCWRINRSVQRLWREEGLRAPPRTSKHCRLGVPRVSWTLDGRAITP
jgi:hypothetical protein